MSCGTEYCSGRKVHWKTAGAVVGGIEGCSSTGKQARQSCVPGSIFHREYCHNLKEGAECIGTKTICWQFGALGLD